MKWVTANADPGPIKLLRRELGCSELMARLLVQRGLTTSAEVDRFLHPSLSQLHDPFLMCGLDKAVDRILEAVACHEKILIYGDYNVDGMTAVVIL